MFQVEIDYVQCADLDVDAIFDPTVLNPEASQEVVQELHKPAFNPDEINEAHGGYRLSISPLFFSDILTTLYLLWRFCFNKNFLGLKVVFPSKKVAYLRYRIDFPDEHIDVRYAGGGKAEESSSEEEEPKKKTPMIQIDMKGYGYWPLTTDHWPLTIGGCFFILYSNLFSKMPEILLCNIVP